MDITILSFQFISMSKGQVTRLELDDQRFTLPDATATLLRTAPIRPIWRPQGSGATNVEFKGLPGLQIFAWVECVPRNDIVDADLELTGNLVE